MASEIAQLPNESSENKVVLNVQEKNKQMQPQPTITELSQDSIHQIVPVYKLEVLHNYLIKIYTQMKHI